MDWSVRHGTNTLDATNTRLRLGVARCTEFLVDVPSYAGRLNGVEASGFSDTIVSLKRQLPAPFDFALSATAGLGLPTGARAISGRGFQPYVQFPWSHEITERWEVTGMFTLTWMPSESQRSATFEPTLSLERALGPAAHAFVEYVGEYAHERPEQMIDGGAAWRFTDNQQIDFHVGFGLNTSSVDHFFGIGYSFRIDRLFGGPNASH